MKFCLPNFAAETFKAKIASGKINPDKLIQMSSAQRRAFFQREFGESNGKNLNIAFESKLILKNQQAGIIRWAKNAAGMNPEVLKDIVRKVENMTEVLTPVNEKAFLADLAEKRLGMQVTMEEAGKIAKLAKEVTNKKGSKDRLEYGRARVAFSNYVGELKLEASKLKLADFKKDPLKTTGKAISNFGGETKAITGSLDNSSIFNQGWKTLWTNPSIWAKNAAQTFGNLVKSFGGKNVIDELNADIVSRPNYDLMQKAKLAVGGTEEAFPGSLAERIPALGRFFKASQETYTAFVHKTRADVFDKMIQIAKSEKLDLTKAELESIGKLVNSLTGRGNLGVLEPVANVANNLLFSPRFLKSNFDVFTQPISGAGGSNFVRKQAAKNLVKIVTGTATVLAIADALMPGSVEWDARSADFGSIKVGNTRFKIGGGMPGVITLVERMRTGSTKSSVTGKIVDFDKNLYDNSSGFNTFTNFFFNKASPLAALVRDWMKGSNFDGEKFTVSDGVVKMVTPFPVQTYQELASDPESANDLVGMIASTFGINVSNY